MISSQPINQQQMDRQQALAPEEQRKRPRVVQQDPHAQQNSQPHSQAFDEAEDELDDPVGDRSGNG